MINDAYTQYKNQSLSTMAQGELLVRLFDELVKQCKVAELSIEKKNVGAIHDSLSKAQTIITTLHASLDDKYPISKELRDFYIFFAHQLRDASQNKDAAKITAIVPLIKDLRNSFEQADKISRMRQHQHAAVVGG